MAVLTSTLRAVGPLPTVLAVGCVLFTGAGCGMSGGGGGGDSELPVSPAGLYVPLEDPTGATPAREPVVISDPDADLDDPCPVRVDGALWVYLTRRDEAGVSRIVRVQLDELGARPEPAELVLEATEAWEAGGVAAPSVVQTGDGFVLAYQGLDGGLGIATSTDGAAFQRVPRTTPLVGRRPTLLLAEDALWLYADQPEGIARAVGSSGNPATWVEEPGVVLPRGASGAFDAVWAGDPHAVGGRSATGDPWVGLFYVGRGHDGDPGAIGFAASRDGRAFERAATEPVLKPAGGETAPGAWLESTQVNLLYVTQGKTHRAIAAARRP